MTEFRLHIYVYNEPKEISPIYAALSKLLPTLPERVQLELIDVCGDVSRAEQDDVFATPTIDVIAGARVRRIIGAPADPDSVTLEVQKALRQLRAIVQKDDSK